MNEKRALTGLMNMAGILLVWAMAASFLVMLGIQVFFVKHIMQGLLPSPTWGVVAGLLYGLVMQFSRFALALASIKEIAEGRTGRAVFGIALSLGLTVLAGYEAAEVGKVFTAYGDSLYLVLVSVAWVGFLLELRLIINTGGQAARDVAAAAAPSPAVRAAESPEAAAMRAELTRLRREMKELREAPAAAAAAEGTAGAAQTGGGGLRHFEFNVPTLNGVGKH